MLCPGKAGQGPSVWRPAEDPSRVLSYRLCLSQQPVPEQLRIQVSRVSMHDYEALHYDKEQLKEACEWQTGGGGLGGKELLGALRARHGGTASR